MTIVMWHLHKEKQNKEIYQIKETRITWHTKLSKSIISDEFHLFNRLIIKSRYNVNTTMILEFMQIMSINVNFNQLLAKIKG
jgi:hypothetical protein